MASEKSKSETNELGKTEKSLDDVINTIGMGKFQVQLIFIFGLCQTADAMEMLLLSVIGPELRCQWMLSDAQVAFITTFVFIGMGIGAPTFGWVADSYGRLGTLVVSTLITILYGCLSGASLSYPWILLSRFIVGFGIGGILSSLSVLFTELTPKSFRGKGLIIVLAFWAFGALFECALAYFIMPRFGWRWLIVASTCPLILSAIGFFLLPESPRYLLTSGQHDRAKEVVNKIARTNSMPEFQGRLVLPSAFNKGQFQDFFHKNYRLTTILLFIIWLNCGFGYYGNVLLSTTLPEVSHRCLQNMDQTSARFKNFNSTDDSCCRPLRTEDYVTLTISSLGELPSFFITVFCCECLGRRWSLRINAILAAGSFFLLNVCFSSQIENAVFLLNRAFTNATFLSAYLYTSEIYPTSIRSLGIGLCSSFARLGAITTPFVAQLMLTKTSVLSALLVYTCVAFIGFLAAAILPIETKDRVLMETVHSSSDLMDQNDDVQPLQLQDVKDPHEYSTFKDK